jgi:Carboxypeptidase regulatory-like domain
MGLAVIAPVFPQTRAADDATPRSVQGVVTDSGDKPAEGAVVQLKDTKTLQIRSFVTRADGMYHFHGLSSNVDYELKAEHQGANSGAKTLSSFDSRKSAVINLKMGK